ncbi:hypothetical protein QM012_007572 [Aureobasidium pullulans]|uniref:Aminoglycoside phosphotransferase domain-containing protein n=1 Tax=Aureobasidium pullulans TaxID=5580 RepID=A0ABR0TPY6_AURPU
MSAIDNEDQAGKDRQRTFIHELFDSVFHLPIQNITTLPRCNNNFVHFVEFSTHMEADTTLSDKPGTSAISTGTSKAVFRVGNPAAMFNHAVKVENTVAMMHLTRQALSAFSIVPKVYAWSSVGEPSGTGWILEEYMPGINQMARILKAVQDFNLPPKAAGFGGLAFDDAGEVINGPYVVEPYNGPYPDMISMYKGMMQAQLLDADRSPVVKGYRDSGLRDRLNAFAERGLEDTLTKILPQHVRPNLIIGDVVIANLLFDPNTLQVTGLVDFDCSHTGHPLHEYFFSSFSVKYYIVSAEPEVASAIFDQYPSPLPQSEPISGPEARDDDPPQWELMELFERELAKAGAARPSNISGAEEITKVYEVMAQICPFHFVMDKWTERQSEERLQSCKEEQMKILDKALSGWGF